MRSLSSSLSHTQTDTHSHLQFFNRKKNLYELFLRILHVLVPSSLAHSTLYMHLLASLLFLFCGLASIRVLYLYLYLSV